MAFTKDDFWDVVRGEKEPLSGTDLAFLGELAHNRIVMRAFAALYRETEEMAALCLNLDLSDREAAITELAEKKGRVEGMRRAIQFFSDFLELEEQDDG